MSDDVWRWDERGSSLAVYVMREGGLRVEVSVTDYPPGLGIELPPRAITELAEWLDAQLEVPSMSALVEAEQETRIAETERDEAVARAEKAEARVEHLEHLATALQAQLVETEQTLARMRAAMSALPEGIEVPR